VMPIYCTYIVKRVIRFFWYRSYDEATLKSIHKGSSMRMTKKLFN